MPVTITRHEFSPGEEVSFDLLVNTVEKNRDRIRTTSGMLLTLAGILTSFCAGLVLFLVDKVHAGRATVLLFGLAIVVFVVSAIVAIVASFLNTKHAIVDKTQFLTDLLHLYNAELRLLRIASVTLIFGLLLLSGGALSLALERWH
jgi:Na+/melibiose symporter-like transporter